ncbi:MAG: hypothetical protein H6550_15325 [Chitinophagales bacterium]|nr:hypothetical protein [Chitinophagales bacterium]
MTPLSPHHTAPDISPRSAGLLSIETFRCYLTTELANSLRPKIIIHLTTELANSLRPKIIIHLTTELANSLRPKIIIHLTILNNLPQLDENHCFKYSKCPFFDCRLLILLNKTQQNAQIPLLLLGELVPPWREDIGKSAYGTNLPIGVVDSRKRNKSLFGTTNMSPAGGGGTLANNTTKRNTSSITFNYLKSNINYLKSYFQTIIFAPYAVVTGENTGI